MTPAGDKTVAASFRSDGPPISFKGDEKKRKNTNRRLYKGSAGGERIPEPGTAGEGEGERERKPGARYGRRSFARPGTKVDKLGRRNGWGCWGVKDVCCETSTSSCYNSRRRTLLASLPAALPRAGLAISSANSRSVSQGGLGGVSTAEAKDLVAPLLPPRRGRRWKRGGAFSVEQRVWRTLQVDEGRRGRKEGGEGH